MCTLVKIQKAIQRKAVVMASMSTYTSPRVGVVGCGITGAATAVKLAQHGCQVTVFDLGRFLPGGRLSSRLPRSPADPQFDHGAQVIGPPQSPAFDTVLQQWISSGLVAPWHGATGVFDAKQGRFSPPQGSCGSTSSRSFGVPDHAQAYVGVPSMSHIVTGHLKQAPGIDLKLGTRVATATLTQGLEWHLEGISGGSTEPQSLGSYNAIVLADSLAAKAGSPGHVKLTSSHDTTGQLVDACAAALSPLASIQRMPLFTLMVAFDPAQLPNTQTRLLPFNSARVENSKHLAWICEDSSKPGRPQALTTLIAITTPEYAQELLGVSTSGALPAQTPEYLAHRADRMWQDIQQELRAAAGSPLPTPKQVSIHRWGSAYTQPPLGNTCISVALPGRDGAHSAAFAAAGDFCLGPGIENAVLSGLGAADAILAGLKSAAKL